VPFVTLYMLVVVLYSLLNDCSMWRLFRLAALLLLALAALPAPAEGRIKWRWPSVPLHQNVTNSTAPATAAAANVVLVSILSITCILSHVICLSQCSISKHEAPVKRLSRVFVACLVTQTPVAGSVALADAVAVHIFGQERRNHYVARGMSSSAVALYAHVHIHMLCMPNVSRLCPVRCMRLSPHRVTLVLCQLRAVFP